MQAAGHPLEPLDATELKVAFESVIGRFRRDPSLPDARLRFPIAALAEPDKQLVLGWTKGAPIPRRAEVHVTSTPRATAT